MDPMVDLTREASMKCELLRIAGYSDSTRHASKPSINCGSRRPNARGFRSSFSREVSPHPRPSPALGRGEEPISVTLRVRLRHAVCHYNLQCSIVGELLLTVCFECSSPWLPPPQA